MGLKRERVRGEPFFALMAEFMEASKLAYGEHVLIQVGMIHYIYLSICVSL